MYSNAVFTLSDYVAQQNPGYMVRWNPQHSRYVLLVSRSKLTPFKWRLAVVDEEPEVLLNAENKFYINNGVTVSYRTIDSVTDEDLPKIFHQAFSDYYDGKAAPRHINSKPYFTQAECDEIESKFLTDIVNPCLDTHTVYCVNAGGTHLCSRLGIITSVYEIIYNKHYSLSTYQDDEGVVEPLDFYIPEPEEPVLIIDDLVSSGRTALSIIKKFKEKGVDKITFAAPFDVVASREESEVDVYLSTIRPVSNHYWMYGRGMDLFTENSRNSKNIFGADKSFDFETEEDINALLDFFNKHS